MIFSALFLPYLKSCLWIRSPRIIRAESILILTDDWKIFLEVFILSFSESNLLTKIIIVISWSSFNNLSEKLTLTGMPTKQNIDERWEENPKIEK